MKVLVACEYSGRVRDAFTALGHAAMSCDILPTEQPGWHYRGDVRDVLDEGWDLMIAHPPCTYLTCAAEWAYKDEQSKRINPGTLIGEDRRQARVKALEFVELLWRADIRKVAIENPVGVINTKLPDMPKPQWIQQYEFGEDASKKTGLWLRGLPPLRGTKRIEPRMVNGKPRWGNQTDTGQNRETPGPDRWKKRSITPKGIAEAMAMQWGGIVV